MFWLFFCRFAAGEGWSDSLARTLKVPICPSGPHVHRVPPGSRYRCKLPLQVLAQGSARLHTLSHFLTIGCLIEPIFFFLTSTTPDKQNTQRTCVPLARRKKEEKNNSNKKQKPAATRAYFYRVWRSSPPSLFALAAAVTAASSLTPGLPLCYWWDTGGGRWVDSGSQP